MFIPTTAEGLDTDVYDHTASLLYGSAFFVHLQEDVRQRNTQRRLIMSQMWDCRVKNIR